MQISFTQNQGTLSVVLSGGFTFADHGGFRDALQKIAAPDVRDVVFNFSNVESVDSAALGMMLLARDACLKTRKAIVIEGSSGQVRKTFELAKFNEMFVMR